MRRRARISLESLNLRLTYDAIPAKVRDNLEALYLVRPGLQARLFLATFGRFLFSRGMKRDEDAESSCAFIVEVKLQGVSKALVAKRLLSTMQEKGILSDFVLCLGDYRYDEDMFMHCGL